MTAANLVANGASLEDCHSNLFALTDLSGIKWRSYTATSHGPLVGPLDDPVLRSFANCLANDILSVWRKVPGVIPDPNIETPPPGASNRSELSRTRELWVYWYGEEPDFTDIIADELKVNEPLEGTWDQGLTYECRTLLFKALHNLLERCLLSRNFVRLGKWFVRPYGQDSEHDDRSEHVLFSFSFFLHGESTVCTSVDIQQHQPLRRLAIEHLAAAQVSATGFQVLLSPYGLNGVLTGQTFKHSDQNTQKLLNEWRQFYHIDVTTNTDDNEENSESTDCHEQQQLPPAVEVLVGGGGVRMCYPTSFVLVAITDDVHHHPPSSPQGNFTQHNGLHAQQPGSKSANMPSVMSSVSMTPPTSPCEQGETKITMMSTSSYQDHNGVDYSLSGMDMLQLYKVSPKIAQKLVGNVLHDSLANPLTNRPQGNDPTPAPPPPPPSQTGTTSTNEDGASGSGATSSSSSSTAATTTTTTTTTTSCTSNASTMNAVTGGFWDFTDPSVKAPCSCCRQKIHPKGRPGFSFGKGFSHMSGSSMGSSKHKLDSKQEKQQMRNARPLTPFHHRSSMNDDLLSMDHDSTNQRLGMNQPHMVNSTHQDCKKKLPSHTVKPASNLEMGLNDSPHSAVPSPLYPPPNANSNAERTMPTLSPYPPPRPNSDAELSNPMTNASFLRNETQLVPNDSIDSNENTGIVRTTEHHVNERDSEDENSRQEELSWMCYKLPQTEEVGFKRPALPSHKFEDDDTFSSNLETLYSIHEEQEFYHQPVKKLKPDYKLEPEVPAFDKKVPILFALEPKAPQQPSPEPIDPYEFSEDQPENVTQTGTPYSRNRGKEGKKGRGILQRRNSIRSNKQQDRKKQEDEQKKAEEERLKQEQQHQQQQQPQSQAPSSTGTAAPSDKNPLVNLKSPLSGLPLARHDPSASLMRETDLAVTANDLDQLFESSDDDECGGAFDSLSQKISMITADDSVMKPSSTHNKGSSLNSTNNGYLMTSSELARMFPTPPSLECNPGSAEYINPDSAPGSSLLDLPSAIPDLMEIEIEESLGSPKPEPIKDWSFVFKIPVMQRYFGSSMYAPLKSLPSSKLPPLKFPNNCLYKPSWQVGLSQKQDYLPPSKDLPSVSSVDTDMIKATQHPMLPLPSAGTPGVLQSPATFHATQEHHQNFESFSPASTPSSYVKNLNSIEPPTPANNIPEAHSLFVNLVLSDSLLNLFKDRNFDSCVICVCNMNIKGNDASLYLNDNQAQYKCVCGFSAIKNRRYGTGSGLFAEDEQDITGQQHDIALWAQNTDHMDPDPTRKAVNNTEEGNQSLTEGRRRVPDILVDVIKDQCSSPYGTLCQSDSVVLKHRSGNNSGQIARNQLELSDGCDACFSALELGRQLLDGSNNKLDDTMWKGTYLHSWAFTTVDVRSHLSSQDIVRILTTLRPILQDVVQRKRSSRSWEPPQFIVQGPLTWHTFFRTASRDKAESPEPLPVPSFLVGHDKDWLSLSPYALHYWDKLLLEPQCATHDVAYVVVTPDNDFILQCTKAFFKELGAVYETCRLGRHAPACTKVLRDGIMRVRKSVVKKIGDQPVDSWFSQFGSIPDAAKLKLYAQVCRHYLAPLLSTEPVDGSIFVTSKPEKSIHISSLMSGSNHSSSSGMGASGTVDSSHHSMPGSTSNLSSSAAHGDSHDGLSEPKESCKRAVVESDDDKIPPFVVVYLVDPFTYAKEYDDGCQAVFSTGLLRCFTEMLPTLPENLRKTISVQVVPLQHIIEMARKERSTTSLDKMKGLAFSVFTQCRRFMAPTLPNKSLTGFGPAADMELVLQTKEAQELQFKLYTPPYILAPLKDKQTELTETFGEAVQQCGELFVGYCLSHDQRWLLASCTDLRGEMMETCMINIDIPNSKRRKKVSQRKHAIRKLWDFILGVTATTALPWRLVIGRLGRLGHGEIKDWAVLLNRKTLLSRSRQLRDMCKTCNFTVNTADYPCIISACLVSMEPDPTIRMMADSVSMDRTGRSAFSQQNQTMLHSPGDATCTHIQVFPTSATTQVASSGYTTETVDPFGGANDSAMVDDLLFPETDLNDDDLDFFDFGPESPTHIGSPDPSQLSCTDGRAGSPSATQTGLQVNGDISSKSTSGQLLGADSEEAFILQQPLALGFYTSTTPTGPLPSWFWVSCPQAETSCPIFLKTALHVHTASVHQSDDNIMQHRHTHQLDSNLTTDVLRYVLENYNALSWLTVDPSTKDRRSCLPIHFVVLMQLYNTLSALL